MSLKWFIPAVNELPFTVGPGYSSGWIVWSVQRAINRMSYTADVVSGVPTPIAEDGTYGMQTSDAIEVIQRLFGITHSKFGTCDAPTQRHIIKFFSGDHKKSPLVYRAMYKDLPDNLLYSVCEGESAYTLGCISWNVNDQGEKESADLGPYQDSVMMSEFNDKRVQHAFDVRVQTAEVAAKLYGHYKIYLPQAGCAGSVEKAWRLAALYHNWPVGADRLASTLVENLPPSWFEDADWVLGIGGPSGPVRLKDGTEVRTPYDWARFYSLGWPEHNWPGSVTKHVTAWQPQG